MSITKEYIQGLSRQLRIMIMAWIVESLQEEEVDWTPSDEQRERIAAIEARIKSGDEKTYSLDEMREHFDALNNSVKSNH